VPIYENVELTPKEHMMMEFQKDEAREAREHAIVMKKLEIELARDKYAGEIELRKLEAKWSSWLRLPSLIIKWPLFIFFGFGYVIDSIKGNDPTNNFWKFIK